ncbi:hypothetical protein GCM10027360_10950 [Amycolatopsis echigonensis]
MAGAEGLSDARRVSLPRHLSGQRCRLDVAVRIARRRPGVCRRVRDGRPVALVGGRLGLGTHRAEFGAYVCQAAAEVVQFAGQAVERCSFGGHTGQRRRNGTMIGSVALLKGWTRDGLAAADVPGCMCRTSRATMEV